MTHLIRTIATNINALAGAHYCAPRRKARMQLRLAILDSNSHLGEPRTVTFNGYTCDISATGLAILLPVTCFSEQLLNQRQRTLRIIMELASGTIEADARIVRYEPLQLNDGLSESGCLLGAEFLNMRASDRQRFVRYLRSLN
ncbi:MAG TPA: PilZ domain-containing protein [Pyrinomonadaceae bacterium]|jgi:hypothetical protein